MEADGRGWWGTFMVTFGLSKEDLVVMFSTANFLKSTKMKNTHRRCMIIVLVIFFFFSRKPGMKKAVKKISLQ